MERLGDFLLTPARALFGGRRVIIFHDGSAHISTESWTKTAEKIAALVTLPFGLIGAFLKLSCLIHHDYRSFCTQDLSKAPPAHPKLVEMFWHVHSIADFVVNPSQLSRPLLASDVGRLTFKPLDLFECRCEDSHAFDRLRNPRRDRLENGIVQRLIETQPNQRVQLMSVGSGGLLSDFMILEKLILAGFKNIAIDCIDPSEMDLDRLERVREFFRGYPDLFFEIAGFTSIDHLPEEKRDYSAVVAIDYDSLCGYSIPARFNALSDLMKARSRLSERGFLALGFGDEDVLSSYEMDPVVLTPNPSMTQRFIADLTRRLPKKERLAVAIPGLRPQEVPLFLYALAMVVEKFPQTYSSISISYLDDCCFSTSEFKTMVSSLFPHLSCQVSPHNPDQKYDLFLTDYLSASDPRD